jgi:molecular chaperone GrpE
MSAAENNKSGEPSPPFHSGFDDTIDAMPSDLETTSQRGGEPGGPAELPESAAHDASGNGPAGDELTEAKAQLLRMQAELDNARKRWRRDAEQQVRFASTALLRDLLEVSDNLKRAIESGAGESAAGSASSALLEGVRMVQQQFQSALAKHHCQAIEALGQPFDPNLHEALAQAPSPEVPAGHVMFESVVGYRLHDRVIRPSQVIVSTGSST